MIELDNLLVELLNAIFNPLLGGIVEHAKEIEKIKEKDAQNIGEKECCVQNEEQEV